MHVSHMTRRTFLRASELVAGTAVLGTLAACGNKPSSEASGGNERQIPVDEQA